MNKGAVTFGSSVYSQIFLVGPNWYCAKVAKREIIFAHCT